MMSRFRLNLKGRMADPLFLVERIAFLLVRSKLNVKYVFPVYFSPIVHLLVFSFQLSDSGDDGEFLRFVGSLSLYL